MAAVDLLIDKRCTATAGTNRRQSLVGSGLFNEFVREVIREQQLVVLEMFCIVQQTLAFQIRLAYNILELLELTRER